MCLKQQYKAMNAIHPKVSVIIPVYKAEKYIARCIVSLFEQTLSSLEYIFVDDCSPDNSINILETIMQKYPHRISHVKLLRNEENIGVGRSRQRGLDNATGEYVIHCDPDDWVEPKAYEDLYGIAIRDNADMVICGIAEERDGKVINSSPQVNDQSNNALINDLFTGRLHGSLCNKLINHKFIADNHISFIDGLNMCEDLTFCIQVLQKQAKISMLDHCYYHYDLKINPNSISSKKSKVHSDQYFKLLHAYNRLISDKHSMNYHNAITFLAYWAFMHNLFSTKEYVKMHLPKLNHLVFNELGMKEKIITTLSALGAKAIMFNLYLKLRHD